MAIQHDLADPESITDTWRTSIVSLYGQLEDFSVSVGQKVVIGEQIGRLGMSGTTSPYLHFEIMLGTQYQDTTGYGAQPNPDGWIDPTRFISAHRNAPLVLGNFNTDGKSDILWRHDDGTLAMWLMNGAQLQSGLGITTVSAEWHIIGVGDFNADGKSDLLWRHDDGTVALWLMNGAQLQSGLAVQTIPNEWHIAGVGDFNADGKSDILWRHDDGTVAAWLMNGAQLQSGAGIASIANSWHIIGTGDFDDNRKSDILWRHDDGTVAMWLMNGTQLQAGAAIGTVPKEWNVVPHPGDRAVGTSTPNGC